MTLLSSGQFRCDSESVPKYRLALVPRLHIIVSYDILYCTRLDLWSSGQTPNTPLDAWKDVSSFNSVSLKDSETRVHNAALLL